MPPIETKPRKTIGIVGSRRRATWTDLSLLLREFDKVYQKGDRIVSGGCQSGGDAFAETIARNKGVTMIIHFADWVGIGKNAGFKRNTYIAEDCDILIALVAEDRTGGTEDTIKKAQALGKEVIII